MRRAWVISALVAVMLAGSILATASNPSLRVSAIETLCEMGLPNLSRPPELDAEELGCTVLGPLRTERGFHEGAFEHSMLVVGDRYRRAADGAYANETAWFESAPGIEDIGAHFRPPPAPEHCFMYVSGIAVEGWMTLSEGGYGHLNGYSRAFYARRIIGMSGVQAEQVADMAPPIREFACRWTGEAWVSIDDAGVTTPTPP